MKTIFLKLAIFAGLFLLADFGLGLFFEFFYTKSNNINIRDANHGFLEDVTDDILIFGASELSHALISSKIQEATDMTTYNLACDACGIYYQYPMLETVLAKHTPKIIVLSSNQMNAENLRYIAKLYPFYKKNKHVKRMVDELRPLEKIKLFFNGYIYNSKFIRMFDSTYANLSGYVPIPVEESRTWLTDVNPLPEAQVPPMSKRSVAYFQKFVQKATDAGTKVYVFIPPVLKTMNVAYRRRMMRYINDSKAYLIDFSEDKALLSERNLYFDPVHLNDLGARQVTDRFLAILKEDGVY